jgi:hypothetical protein
LAFVLARESFDQESGLERNARNDVPAIDAARAIGALPFPLTRAGSIERA